MTNEYINSFVAQGFPITPVPYGKKGPILKDWPNLTITTDNIAEYFPAGVPTNIALQLGKAGSRLADLDLDCPEAIYFAEIFAPATGFIYGRKSKPRSHRIYKISGGEIKTKSFKTSDGMLIELLGEGHLCNLPGSTHETGEEYTFDQNDAVSEISYSGLYDSARLIAVCCLLAREWPSKGSRHEFSLCVAGALCKAGISDTETVQVVWNVAKYCGDEEATKRRNTAEDTCKQFQAGKPIKGFSGLKDMLSADAFKSLEDWLESSLDAQLDEIVDALNSKYAYIVLGGKPRILVENHDVEAEKPEIGFISVDAFRGLYQNKRVCVGHGTKGPIYKSQAEIWFQHRARRTYENMVFEPGKTLPENVFNYYRGFGIEPIDDPELLLCQKFLEHWHQVVCGGDNNLFGWVLAWLADAVQNPGTKPGTAIILIGKQGCGKSCGVDYMKPIFAPHFLKISDKSHLYGKFNSHQQGVLMMLGEEISVAADKKFMGIIKDMITSDHMMIERKGVDVIAGRNCLRLILTSNDEFVIPADTDDRRFLVLEVSNDHVGDFDYFEKLIAERKNGGAASLLNFLLNYDCSQFNLRRPPQTTAMTTQKIGGLHPIAKAIFKFLSDGHIHPEASDWPEWISTQQFQSIALKTIKLEGTTKGIQTQIGSELQKYLGPIQKTKKTLPKSDEDTGKPYKTILGESSEVQSVYVLPDLQECRKRFTQVTGIQFNSEDT